MVAVDVGMGNHAGASAERGEDGALEDDHDDVVADEVLRGLRAQDDDGVVAVAKGNGEEGEEDVGHLGTPN